MVADLPGPWWQCCVGGGHFSGGQSQAKRQHLTERVPCEHSCSHCLLSTRMSKLVKLVGPSFCDSEPSITCAECGQSQGSSVQVLDTSLCHSRRGSVSPWSPDSSSFHCRAPQISTPRGRIPFIMPSSPAPPIAP